MFSALFHVVFLKELGSGNKLRITDGYKELISTGPTQLLRNEVLQFFGGHDAFIKFHDREIIIEPGDWEDV